MDEQPGGLFGPDVQALMAQFQPNEEDRKRARREQLMAMGFAMLANPTRGQELKSIGQAGLLGMQAHNDAMESAGRERTRGMAGVGQAFDIANKAETYRDNALLRQQQAEFARRVQERHRIGPPPLSPPPIGAIGPPPPGAGGPPPGGPPPEGMPEQLGGPDMPPPSTGVQPGTPPQLAAARPAPPMPMPAPQAAPPTSYRRQRAEELLSHAEYWDSVGRTEKAKTFYDQAEKIMPKLKETRYMQENGKRVVVNMYDDGTHEIVRGVDPDAEKAVQINTGRQIIPADPYTLQPLPGAPPTPLQMSEAEEQRIGFDRERLAIERANAARAARAEGKGQIITTDSGVFRVGTDNVAVPVTDNAGAPIKSADGKPLTLEQGKAASYTMRMEEANRIIAELEKQGVNLASPKMLLAWNPATTYLASPTAQKVYNAQLNFVTAILRDESGANYGPDEIQKEYKKYFPQPGEGKLVWKQKSDMRDLAIKGMRIKAAHGLKSVPQAAREPTPEEIEAELRRRRGGQ